jgi:hypothetical protein
VEDWRDDGGDPGVDEVIVDIEVAGGLVDEEGADDGDGKMRSLARAKKMPMR